MKKILILLAIIISPFSLIYAQSFGTGAVVISGNFGVDGNVANRQFTTPEGNAQTLNGTAPASNFNLDGEVGIFRWLGVGVIGRLDNYTSQNNSVTQTTPSEKSADLGFTGNLHFITIKSLDLFAGVDYGFSHLMFNTNNLTGTSSSSYGSWDDVHATARIYFGRVGFNVCLYVPSMSYSNFKSSNESVGDYVINSWKSTGYGASLGLQVRL